MNIKTLTAPLNRGFHRTGLVLSKNSPQILFGIGVAGVFGTGALAYICGNRAKERYIEYKANMNELADKIISEDRAATPEENQIAGNMVIKTVLGIAKDLAPAVLCAALTVASFATSNRVLSKRLGALGAVLAATEASYEAYRDRVREKLGNEAENDLYRNVTTETVETTEVGEDGKEKKVKKTVKKPAAGDHGRFSAFFDEASIYWRPSGLDNYTFCVRQERLANELLRIHGHVFLNEVFDMLDMPRTAEGSVYGWVKTKGDTPYISFGLTDGYSEKIDDFKYGLERSVLLEFNVQGIIYDMI